VGSIIFEDLFHLYLIKRRIKPFFHYKYKYLGSMSGSFPLKTVCRGSFHFLLQNERIGLVRSKTSWKWAEYELCLWSAFISWRKPSFSEMSIFSLFSSWKRAFYKFGHGGAPWLANISANLRKNSKRSKWNTLGLGENWFMKKTRSKKSRDTVPLTDRPNLSFW